MPCESHRSTAPRLPSSSSLRLPPPPGTRSARSRRGRRVIALALALVLSSGVAWGAAGSRNVSASGTGVRSSWSPPLAGEPTVLRAFDRPAQTWSAGHRGVDLASSTGTAVLAPRAGTVTFAGTVVDRPVLTVTHDDGLRSSLEPVIAGVAMGDRVEAGQPVGELGGADTHCDPEARCLHWGVRDGEEYLDPMLLLSGGPVVLLSRARVVHPAGTGSHKGDPTVPSRLVVPPSVRGRTDPQATTARNRPTSRIEPAVSPVRPR